MFEGDLVEGELEIGQVAAQIETITPAAEIVREFIQTYNQTLERLKKIN
jgi:enoyl-[acyl-carrier protein] reductase II